MSILLSDIGETWSQEAAGVVVGVRGVRLPAIAPLDDVLVLDASTRLAGSYCSKLLTDAGAGCVMLEPASGHPLRHRSIVDGETSPLFDYLAASKHSVVATSLTDRERTELLDRAHVVICDDGSQAVGGPRELATEMPGAVVVSITPFGLATSWSQRPATDGTLQALSGGPGAQRGSPRLAPLLIGGEFSEWVGGMFAAGATLLALRRAERDGRGELVDVSQLEAQVMSQTMYPVTYATMAGEPQRLERMSNLPSIHATSDGHVGFMVVTGQQWLDFCALIERPDWAEDQTLLRFLVRNARRDELVGVVDEWMAKRTTTEVIETAELFRIPVAEIGNGASIPEFDHFVERSAFVRNPTGGFLQPARPYSFSDPDVVFPPVGPSPDLGSSDLDPAELPTRTTGQPTEQPGDDGALAQRPLEGIRIADFTAFWAGPIVGNILGMFGADVIHVESPTRPDGMRFASVKEMGEADWLEWSPGFQGTNTDKRGVAIDLNSEEGRTVAERIIATCDVVIENYSPRVFDSWGFGDGRVAEINPRAILLRMPAFGLSGPWRDRVGYAQTMEQVSGLAWATGHPEAEPEMPNGPCDAVAGGHAVVALLAALRTRDRTGRGMLVEAPMVGSALNIAAEQVIEHSANGRLLVRIGNRSRTGAPQGTYLTASIAPSGKRDRWVVISVGDDDQWRRCASVVAPELAGRDDLATFDGRRAAHDEIDAVLGEWCATREVDDVVDAFGEAGVPAAPVILPHEQVDLVPLGERGFFEELEHPVTGAATHSTVCARFERGPDRWHRRPSPCLGQDNRDVLLAAGYDAASIDDLVERGVVGSANEGSLTAW